MDAQDNLLNYYINYNVRKDQNYLTSDAATTRRRRRLTFANVVHNLNLNTSPKRNHEKLITPANSFDNSSAIADPPDGDGCLSSNHDVLEDLKGGQALNLADTTPQETLPVGGQPVNEQNDDVTPQSETPSSRRPSTISIETRQRRPYRMSARPQLYDVVAKQRQFDRLYRLTDYESDDVKARRENIKILLSQICHEGPGSEKGEDAGGDADFNDADLPVYLQLLAMQPALVPISMLLPPGGKGRDLHQLIRFIMENICLIHYH